jgi:hypothetical protein
MNAALWRQTTEGRVGSDLGCMSIVGMLERHAVAQYNAHNPMVKYRTRRRAAGQYLRELDAVVTHGIVCLVTQSAQIAVEVP